MNAERFSADTSEFPRRFYVAWCIVVGLLTGGLTVALAVQLSPLAFALAAAGLASLGGAYSIFRAYTNPDWNYAELGAESLIVKFRWMPFWGNWFDVPYSAIERVEENVKHSLLTMLADTPWRPYAWAPYAWAPFVHSGGTHLDVRLSEQVEMKGIRMTWVWVNVLHLKLTEPERLASALRERARLGAAVRNRA